jgi:alkanesulfonate monooxygenase SsuD/methylene tetrahydromethanopterin reductase-like flavin-dependent oxidoreductase (luciferase family)
VIATFRFTSIDYQRVDDHSDRVVVLCDEDRPNGLPTLVGKTVSIDGKLYDVVGADDLHRPLKRGDRMVLWVGVAGGPGKRM